MKRFFGEFIGGRGGAGLLFIRLVAGIGLMQHGWDKIQNPTGWMGPDAAMPGFLQLLAAISEFFGGAALALGLLTPLAALGVFFTMAFAMQSHISKGAPWVGKGGYEPAFMYLAVAVLLMLTGPGRFSLDALLFSRSRVHADHQMPGVASSTT